jgi:DNA polymerase/3'-5' exonuclease PolX
LNNFVSDCIEKPLKVQKVIKELSNIEYINVDNDNEFNFEDITVQSTSIESTDFSTESGEDIISNSSTESEEILLTIKN